MCGVNLAEEEAAVNFFCKIFEHIFWGKAGFRHELHELTRKGNWMLGLGLGFEYFVCFVVDPAPPLLKAKRKAGSRHELHELTRKGNWMLGLGLDFEYFVCFVVDPAPPSKGKAESGF